MNNQTQRSGSIAPHPHQQRVAVRSSQPGKLRDAVTGARLRIRDVTILTARGDSHTSTGLQTPDASLRGTWYLSGTRNEKSGVRLRIAS